MPKYLDLQADIKLDITELLGQAIGAGVQELTPSVEPAAEEDSVDYA